MKPITATASFLRGLFAPSQTSATGQSTFDALVPLKRGADQMITSSSDLRNPREQGIDLIGVDEKNIPLADQRAQRSNEFMQAIVHQDIPSIKALLQKGVQLQHNALGQTPMEMLLSMPESEQVLVLLHLCAQLGMSTPLQCITSMVETQTTADSSLTAPFDVLLDYARIASPDQQKKLLYLIESSGLPDGSDNRLFSLLKEQPFSNQQLIKLLDFMVKKETCLDRKNIEKNLSDLGVPDKLQGFLAKVLNNFDMDETTKYFHLYKNENLEDCTDKGFNLCLQPDTSPLLRVHYGQDLDKDFTEFSKGLSNDLRRFYEVNSDQYSQTRSYETLVKKIHTELKIDHVIDSLDTHLHKLVNVYLGATDGVHVTTRMGAREAINKQLNSWAKEGISGIHLANKAGLTPAQLAVSYSGDYKLDLLKTFLSAGAQPQDVLNAAMVFNNAEAIEYLIDEYGPSLYPYAYIAQLSKNNLI